METNTVKSNPERKKLDKHLTKIATEYNEAVDIAAASKSNVSDVYHEKTGHSLVSAIQEAYINSPYFKSLSGLDPLKSAYSTAKTLKAYENFTNGEFNKGTIPWEKGELSREEATHKAVGFALYANDQLHEKFDKNNKRNEHTKLVDKFSDLKFGDVVQIYQPYSDMHSDTFHKKDHINSKISEVGQNRYYGIIQKLPNGDFLAVDLRGHRQRSADSVPLEFNERYAYPTSRNVQPSLDKNDQLLVQLPKKSIASGSALREKYEAAAYDKPFDASQPIKIKVLEMSPDNIKKLKDYRNYINETQLDIGWSKDRNEVIAASDKGKKLYNPAFYHERQYQIKSGIYEKRNAMLTAKINTQTLARIANYGEDKVPAPIKYKEAPKSKSAEKERSR